MTTISCCKKTKKLQFKKHINANIDTWLPTTDKIHQLPLSFIKLIRDAGVSLTTAITVLITPINQPLLVLWPEYSRGTRPVSMMLVPVLLSASFQIMACCLFGPKSLSESVLGYSQLNLLKQASVKLQSRYKHFHSRKYIWKYRLQKDGHFVQGEDELNETYITLHG